MAYLFCTLLDALNTSLGELAKLLEFLRFQATCTTGEIGGYIDSSTAHFCNALIHVGKNTIGCRLSRCDIKTAFLDGQSQLLVLSYEKVPPQLPQKA